MVYATAHAAWILNVAVDIDRHCPSFCGEFFRMSDERRQVVAAYLACSPHRGLSAREVGQFLLTAKHNAILSAAFEQVPQGMRKALGRAGRTVHDKRFYPLLFDLLSRSTEGSIGRCIGHLPSLDLLTLQIVERLPERLRRPTFVQAVPDADEALHVSAAYGLLRRQGVSEEVLAAALSSVEHPIALTRAFRRLVEHAEAPLHPVPTTEGYEPFLTGRDVNRAAREFRNCLRSFTTRFLDPEEGHAFATATRDEERAVVHLVRTKSGEWILEGIFGPQNRRPSASLRQQVVRHLKAHGVEIAESTRRAPSDWNSLRRVLDENMLGFDFGPNFDDALDGI